MSTRARRLQETNLGNAGKPVETAKHFFELADAVMLLRARPNLPERARQNNAMSRRGNSLRCKFGTIKHLVEIEMKVPTSLRQG